MNLFDLDTPVVLVDLDVLEANIAAMSILARSGGKRLRPHTKTHKTAEVARMQAAAGAAGFTVAKLGEAEALADAGLNDIFIANQLVGPHKAARLMALANRVAIIVAVDSIEGAAPLAEAAARSGIRIAVRIEIDTGLGRAGARSVEEALAIARFVEGSPGLELEGIFTHEGHLYRAADAGATAGKAAEQMRATAQRLRDAGIACSTVSMGSTPGAVLTAHEPGIDELRPGVYVYNDRTQLRLGASMESCALSVLTTVVSIRPDGRVIVDAGTKTMASDCPFDDRTFGHVVGRPDLQFVGASEEHGHLLAEDTAAVRLGDKLRVVPNHACTCVNMHDTVTAIRSESVEGTWMVIGRGRVR